MSRRESALLVLILTAMTACTPADTPAGDATTTVEPTDTPAVQCSDREMSTPDDVAGPAGDDLVDLSDFQHGYMTRHLIVPIEQAETTAGILSSPDLNLEFQQPDDLTTVLPPPGGEDSEEFEAARAELEGVLQLFTLTLGDEDDRDALDIAEQVRIEDPELDVSPIHAMGEAAHVAWAPGNHAVPVAGAAMPEIGPATKEQYAAVVDSGIHPDAPGLIGNVDLRITDLEPGGGDGHSHGTFVSGLIRHLAPAYCISFARARSVDPTEFTWIDDLGNRQQLVREPQQTLTTELHVAEAIIRLIQRHGNNAEAVLSLNLSVGAYSSLPDDPVMVSIAQALDLWFEEFSHAPVFAAGGNDPVIDPVLRFWPGAYSGVRAVGALNDSAEEIVWDNGAEKVWRDFQLGSRDWITDLAPGSMLANHTSVATVACWSGSSFATAVANGLYLRQISPHVDNGQTSWWPDASPERAEVTGLSFCEGDEASPNLTHVTGD